MQYKDVIPSYTPTFEEISKQMKINQEIVMKEISEHVDKELERFRKEMNEIKPNLGNLSIN